MHVQKQARIASGHPWRIVLATLFAMALVVLWRGNHLYAAELAAPATHDAPANQGDDGNGDDSGGDTSDDVKVHGLLTISPTGGMTGIWVVDGVAYTATESTQFSTLHGDFVVGGCVEVELSESDPTVAKEIGTEEMAKCTGQPGDDDGNDDDDGDDNGNHEGDDDTKTFGVIQALPPGGVLTGTWVISGTSSTVAYTVADSTELETEHGGFAVGVCVKVEAQTSDPTVAKEIETEEDYKCSGQTGDDDHHAEGKLFGVVEQLPEGGLVGLWIVGSKSISVTQQTKLDSEGVFTVGVTVKVEFITTISNAHIAKEIELKFGHHDDDDDDGDFGDHDGREGQAFGVINNRPITGVLGVWEIGFISYTVNEHTKFDDGEELKQGDLVKVKYFVEDDGSRRAFKIDTEDGQGQLDNPNMNKVVGIVDSMPISGFVGTWKIVSALFEADLATRFEEDDGLSFANGAYVEVLYVIENNVRRIVKIETHVPPGAGDDDTVGEVESMDDSAATVAAASPTAIVLDDVSYSVNSATQIIDTNGDVVVGSTVAVNSYKTANGQNVATRIRSVTLDNTLRLPFAQR